VQLSIDGAIAEAATSCARFFRPPVLSRPAQARRGVRCLHAVCIEGHPERGPLRDVNVKERNLSANAGASSTRFADKVGRDPRAEKCRDRSVELPPYGPSTRR